MENIHHNSAFNNAVISLYAELANCKNPVPLYPEWFKCCSQNSNKKDTLCGALYMTILGGGGGGGGG